MVEGGIHIIAGCVIGGIAMIAAPYCVFNYYEEKRRREMEVSCRTDCGLCCRSQVCGELETGDPRDFPLKREKHPSENPHQGGNWSDEDDNSTH